MATYSEHNTVELNQDLPKDGLRRGMVGTIVHIFTIPRLAYEVEFCDEHGRTIAQVPLMPEQIVATKVDRRSAAEQ